MANDDLVEQIQKIVRDEVRPVKDLVEMTKKRVDGQQIFLHTTSDNVRLIKEQQSILNDKSDSHTASLAEIESKLDSYADSYKENQHNIERLDTRLNVVEEELAIEPPEDLKIPHFTE